MRILLADIRYAWRRARRYPGVSLSIIVLLALGMGGITAVFNPIYSTIFAPLPLPQPEQLMRIGGNIPLFRTGTGSFEHEEVLGRLFSNMAAYSRYQTKIRIPDTGKQVEINALNVTENFFETIGVKPLMGYDFFRNEQSSGFVISHRFWRDELAQKSDAVGSYLLSPGGSQFLIIGVMPEGFNFPFDTDIWQWTKSGTMWGISGGMDFIGRLRSGIPARMAAEELMAIDNKSLMVDVALGRIIGSGEGPVLQPLQTHLYGDQRPMLRMLGTAAILFLALVCAGVVNLLIALGARRKQEIATRLVYGATRGNLIFQLLRETLPLVVIGGIAGWWLSEVSGALMWAQMPALRNGAVAVPVKIAFWAALVMVVTLIGGLVPSLYATSLDLNTYLKSSDGGKRRFLPAREILVGVQLSLALALLIGVVVLLRSMMFNVDIPIGWASRDIAVVSVIHPRTENEAGRLRLNHDIKGELSAMPEVVSVGIVSPVPFSKTAIINSSRPMFVYKDLPSQYRTSGLQDWDAEVDTTGISPDGFAVLGIPLVIGRYFTEADVSNLIESRRVGKGSFASVAIINQTLAERLWPGENPVGNVFYNMNKVNYEVVGVVRNFHHIPGTREFMPSMYIPEAATVTNHDILVKLRSNTLFKSFHSNARQRLSGFSLDWVEMKPLNEYVKDATANQRLMLQFLMGFAILGIIVAGLAVYATAILAAAARTKETGIRLAMGARTWDILKLAFWRGIRAILVGVPLGLFLALILCKFLSSALVHVNIRDPLAWLISCALLFAIAAGASLIPALRAIFINPTDALRDM